MSVSVHPHIRIIKRFTNISSDRSEARERERERQGVPGRRLKVCNTIYLCPQQDVAFDLHLRKRSLCGGVRAPLPLCVPSCQRVCLHWNLSTWKTDIRVGRQRVTPTKTTSANNNVPCSALPLTPGPLRRRLSTKILIAATLCVRVAQCWKLV